MRSYSDDIEFWSRGEQFSVTRQILRTDRRFLGPRLAPTATLHDQRSIGLVAVVLAARVRLRVGVFVHHVVTVGAQLAGSSVRVLDDRAALGEPVTLGGDRVRVRSKCAVTNAATETTLLIRRRARCTQYKRRGDAHDPDRVPHSTIVTESAPRARKGCLVLGQAWLPLVCVGGQPRATPPLRVACVRSARCPPMENSSDWHRPSGDLKFHSLSAVVFGGSVITRCRGRWPESHEVEVHTDPPVAERCGGCVRELERFAFDVSDIGGES